MTRYVMMTLAVALHSLLVDAQIVGRATMLLWVVVLPALFIRTRRECRESKRIARHILKGNGDA